MWIECKIRHQDREPDYATIRVDNILMFEADEIGGEPITTVYLKSHKIVRCCITYDEFCRLVNVANHCIKHKDK